MDPPAPGPSQIPGSVRGRATNFSASAPSPPAGRSRTKSSAAGTDTFACPSVRPSSDPAPNRRPRTVGSLGGAGDAPRPTLARGTRARVRAKLIRPTRPPQRVDHRTGACAEPPHGSSAPREPAVIADRAKHSFFHTHQRPTKTSSTEQKRRRSPRSITWPPETIVFSSAHPAGTPCTACAELDVDLSRLHG